MRRERLEILKTMSFVFVGSPSTRREKIVAGISVAVALICIVLSIAMAIDLGTNG